MMLSSSLAIPALPEGSGGLLTTPAGGPGSSKDSDLSGTTETSPTGPGKKAKLELSSSPTVAQRHPARGVARGFSARGAFTCAGFTLIEMMVVMAILALSFGLMLPTIAGFLKNRELDGVGAEFTTKFSTARLAAVSNSSRFLVVFFQEGVRVYNDKLGTWKADEVFLPERAPAADVSVHFDLFFAGRHSAELPKYRSWEKRVKQFMEEAKKPARKGKGREEAVDRIPVDGLIAIVFERDGTMSTRGAGGSDISTKDYREGRSADIVIWQKGNDSSFFVDLQATGAIKSRTGPNDKVRSRREELEEDGLLDDEGDRKRDR